MITNVTKMVVGVDVSKDFLDVCIYMPDGCKFKDKGYPSKKHFRIENTVIGLSKMLDIFSKYDFSDIEQVILESSGGYEHLAIKALEKSGYNAWLVDPKRIRGFVASQGMKAKTDKIDARMIAMFAAQNKPDYKTKKQTSKHNELRELVRRKSDLIKMVGMEKKRLKNPRLTHCKKEISEHIIFMEKQIEEIKIKIKNLIDKNDDWSRKLEIAKSIPGVGETTAQAIISEIPEIGELTEKQVAALVGVAPYPRESGSFIGKASIDGGRFLIRNAVYMSALVCAYHNPDLKEFFMRLKSKGKKGKVALVAVMRKLVILINVLIRDNRTWSPSKHLPKALC